MKKKSLKIVIISIAILAVSLVGYIGVLAFSGPGSADDPMVTQSYVDKQITDLRNSMEQKVTESDAKLQNMKTALEEIINNDNSLFVRKSELSGLLDSKINAATNTSLYRYEMLSLSAEQSLSCKSGTEVVIRSAQVVSDVEIFDILNNKTISSGNTIPAGSLIVFTSNGNLKCNQAGDILIRGIYH